MGNSIETLDALFRARLYLYFHENMLSEGRTNKECEFILQKLALSSGDNLLDLACGHGRHANALARAGLNVVAWDINQDFVQMGITEAQQQNLAVDYQCRNILTLDLDAQFDGIILLFNSLGFFSRKEAQDLLRRMANALKRGGRIFLDIKNRDHISKEIIPFSIVEKEADMMIDRLSFDPKTGTTQNRRTYIKDGQRYEAPFSMTLFNYTDIDRMATEAGLSILKEFGHWDGRTFDQDSRRIILILGK